jgi:hypothetical protein
MQAHIAGLSDKTKLDCTFRCSQQDDKDYADAQPYKTLIYLVFSGGQQGAEFVTLTPRARPNCTAEVCRDMADHPGKLAGGIPRLIHCSVAYRTDAGS